MKYSSLICWISLIAIVNANMHYFEEFSQFGFINCVVNIQNEKEIFYSSSNFNFTLEDCKNLELCSNDLNIDEFMDNVNQLDQYKVYNQVINKNKQILNESFNASSNTHRFSIGNNGIHEDTLYPRFFHYTDKLRLIAVVPVFIICLLICSIMYLQKRKLSTSYNFKFSNLSLILIKYLIAKLFFTIIYLVHLVLFDDFEFKSLGSTIILIALSSINYTFSIATFILATLFAFGYCTVFFSLRNKRGIMLKVIGLMVLYIIQTIPKFLMELREIMDSFYFSFDATPITVSRIFLFLIIVGIISYTAYNTYKNSIREDQRYSLSCLVILMGYIINPFIIVPGGGRDMLEFLKQKYASNTNIWDIGEASGVHVPEIIELIVIIALIYIWRDQKYVEKDEKEYSSLPTIEAN